MSTSTSAGPSPTNPAVEMIIEPRDRPVGSGTVRRLLPFRLRRTVGPFIFCDVMGPEEFAPGVAMNVDAHPHIGLSTLTYLLSGRAVHRDSTGAVQTIEAGAVNWMTAGSGVTHTERGHPDDLDRTSNMFGVQTWVALPDDAEDRAPMFEHAPADAVPVDERPGASIRVATGSAFGLDSPVTGSSPLMLVDLSLGGGSIEIGRDHPERAVLALDGDLTVGGDALPPGSMAVLDRDARPEVAGRGRAIVLGGEPVGKRFIWWNFVHSDQDRIEEAKREWTDQRFPTVLDDHDPWVPLPG
ncbi:MAG: pirin family protein [Actinomycetota bacterium]